MRYLRFYTKQPLTVGETVSLSEETHRHLATVLRLKAGQTLTLFNGDGYDYEALLMEVGKRSSVVKIEKKQENHSESPLFLTLYVALLKGEPFERLLQKATELGVKKIVPILTERSEVHLADDRLSKKYEHWNGILIASAMQCGRAVLPQLGEVIDFKSALNDLSEIKWICSPHDEPTQTPEKSASSLAILIGSEGGLTPEEVALALEKGWQTRHLGKRILRADTAGMVAIVQAQMIYGDN